MTIYLNSIGATLTGTADSLNALSCLLSELSCFRRCEGTELGNRLADITDGDCLKIYEVLDSRHYYDSVKEL